MPDHGRGALRDPVGTGPPNRHLRGNKPLVEKQIRSAGHPIPDSSTCAGGSCSLYLLCASALRTGPLPGLTQTSRRRILFLPSAPVAQLDRVPGYEPGGREFESLRARHIKTGLALSGRRVSSVYSKLFSIIPLLPPGSLGAIRDASATSSKPIDPRFTRPVQPRGQANVRDASPVTRRAIRCSTLPSGT